MNDLTTYRQVRPQMRPGDVIAFWGPRLNPLSGLIEAVTDGGPSHVAIVRQAMHGDTDVTICESTIEGNRNGVQTNPLGATLAGGDPPSSRAALYRLTPAAHARFDLMDFYALCGENDGITRYDVGALFRFLLPTWISQHFTSAKMRSLVCSVWVAEVLEAAHATCGVAAWKMTPADVISLPIFEAPVQILAIS